MNRSTPSEPTMAQALRRARRTLGLDSPNTLAQVGGMGFGENPIPMVIWSSISSPKEDYP